MNHFLQDNSPKHKGSIVSHYTSRIRSGMRSLVVNVCLSEGNSLLVYTGGLSREEDGLSLESLLIRLENYATWNSTGALNYVFRIVQDNASPVRNYELALQLCDLIRRKNIGRRCSILSESEEVLELYHRIGELPGMLSAITDNGTEHTNIIRSLPGISIRGEESFPGTDAA